MMKHVWIVILIAVLGIPYLIWAIVSVMDLVAARKYQALTETITDWFLVLNAIGFLVLSAIALFLYSFCL